MNALQPQHATWCTSHPLDPNDPTYEGACFGDTLDIDFGERHHGDAVEIASLFLTRTDEGTLLNVLAAAAASLSLQPDQIRPFAMALLAHDAMQSGDTVAADYYRGEALHTTVGA